MQQQSSHSYVPHLRSVSDVGMTSSRPSSIPWENPYHSMGSSAPHHSYQQHHNNSGGHYVGEYGNGPRTVDPSLPPLSNSFRPAHHDRYDPGMDLRGNNDLSGSISPINPTSYLPGDQLKHRRTSLESGMNPRKPPPATSRLGLDPVAKAERRREQNRLAQRAFRARAKVREQEQVCALSSMDYEAAC